MKSHIAFTRSWWGITSLFSDEMGAQQVKVTLSQLCLGSERQFRSPRPFTSYLDSDAIAICTPVPKVDPSLLPNPIIHLAVYTSQLYQLLSQGVERPSPCFHTWGKRGGPQGRPWLGGAHCHPGPRSPEAPEQRGKAGAQSRAFAPCPPAGERNYFGSMFRVWEEGIGAGEAN